MRRRVGLAAGLVAVLALSGCGRPPGVDGNLTNGWPTMAGAKLQIPVAGVCWTVPDTQIWYYNSDPVDCSAGSHDTETAYVGTFTGSQAARSTAPNPIDGGLSDAYAQCQKGASDYLGGDWHTAIVDLNLVLPSDPAWAVGARWFRCDLVDNTSPNVPISVSSGTLKGNLSGSRTVAYGCLAVTTDSQHKVLSEKPVACTEPHATEFAGTFTAPDIPWPAGDAAREELADNGCEEVVAKFIGFANSDQWDNPAIGWWESNFDQNQWALGDRTIQCFAYAFTKSGNFVGSVKGIRGKTPKG
jgi:hypothetical protein